MIFIDVFSCTFRYQSLSESRAFPRYFSVLILCAVISLLFRLVLLSITVRAIKTFFSI